MPMRRAAPGSTRGVARWRPGAAHPERRVVRARRHDRRDPVVGVPQRPVEVGHDHATQRSGLDQGGAVRLVAIGVLVARRISAGQEHLRARADRQGRSSAGGPSGAKHDRVKQLAETSGDERMTDKVRLEIDGADRHDHQRQPRQAQRLRRRDGRCSSSRSSPSCASRPTCGRSSGGARASRSRRAATSASIGNRKVELTHHELMRRGHRGIQQLWELDAPVIVACKGWSMGGSFQRALLCDIRIAAEGARFRAARGRPTA